MESIYLDQSQLKQRYTEADRDNNLTYYASAPGPQYYMINRYDIAPFRIYFFQALSGTYSNGDVGIQNANVQYVNDLCGLVHILDV